MRGRGLEKDSGFVFEMFVCSYWDKGRRGLGGSGDEVRDRDA